ncbi:MAG: hypothetical protein IV097_12745 [Burkholderiaceae bacterium]|nr:hypothetical protein [Burkholderiaceae bacterium]
MRALDEISYFVLWLLPGLVLIGIVEPIKPASVIALALLPYSVATMIRYIFWRRTGQYLTRYAKQWTRAKLRMAKQETVDGIKSKSELMMQSKGRLAPLLARIIDVICFVGGPTILIPHVLAFTNSREAVIYKTDDLFWIEVGVGMITFGVLLKYWAAKDKPD